MKTAKILIFFSVFVGARDISQEENLDLYAREIVKFLLSNSDEELVRQILSEKIGDRHSDLDTFCKGSLVLSGML